MNRSKRLAEGEQLPSPFIPAAQADLNAEMAVGFAQIADCLLLPPLLMAGDQCASVAGPRMPITTRRTVRGQR